MDSCLDKLLRFHFTQFTCVMPVCTLLCLNVILVSFDSFADEGLSSQHRPHYRENVHLRELLSIEQINKSVIDNSETNVVNLSSSTLNKIDNSLSNVVNLSSYTLNKMQTGALVYKLKICIRPKFISLTEYSQNVMMLVLNTIAIIILIEPQTEFEIFFDQLMKLTPFSTDGWLNTKLVDF